MIKEIKYNGCSANPSDYECQDGDIAISLNMVNEEGALRPVLAPEEIIRLNNEGDTVVCVHKTAQTENIIVKTISNTLCWTTKADNIDYNEMYGFEDVDIFNVTAVGNILVAATSTGLFYFIYKDGGYITLGGELPALTARPRISTIVSNATGIKKEYHISLKMDDEDLGVKIDFKEKDTLESSGIANLTTDEKSSIYSKIFALINQCSNSLRDKGFFLEPFYIRFAFRMYDGSHIGHTVPVLLVPTTWCKPIMAVNLNNGSYYFNPVFSLSQLNFDIDVNLGQWADFITHIDVFVTEPLIDYSDSADTISRILKYNPNIPQFQRKEYGKAAMMNGDDWSIIDNVINSQNSDEPQKTLEIVPFELDLAQTAQNLYRCHHYIGQYRDDDFIAFDNTTYDIKCKSSSGDEIDKVTDQDINTQFPSFNVYSVKAMRPHEFAYFYFNSSIVENSTEWVIKLRIYKKTGNIDIGYYIETYRADGLNYKDVLTNSSNFYKIYDVEVGENTSGTKTFDKKGVLTSLVTRETLPDIGRGDRQIVSPFIFNYNSRLNAVVGKMRLTSANTTLPIQNPASNEVGNYHHFYFDMPIKKAFVEVYENSQYAYVEIPAEDLRLRDICLFCFPNNNAKRLILYPQVGDSYYELKINLKTHGFMNLSYVFWGFQNLFGAVTGLTIKHVQSVNLSNKDEISYGNMLRLSDVNNPFRFSEEYSVSLPVKEIHVLSTAAKALSQGQFGQFPLYAFTSEGVWALEVSSTGTYSARQPITRDVVCGPESVTQIDSAVLFATDRGIMLLSGSTAQCISDTLNADEPFGISDIPKYDKLLGIFNGMAARDEQVSSNDINMLPFGEFLKGCRMIYDYTNQHLIVYNPDVRYAYVYSLKSQTWGMMRSDIVDNVNSYPEALAMADGARLVDFSKPTASNVTALVITRPFKIDGPNSFKTINTIIQRGMFRSTHVQQVLYGSNDLIHWHTVWSSVDKIMRGFRGSPYKAYRLALVCKFDKGESIYGCTVVYEPRMTNQVR
ncbi:MAG: hypothetical protein ACI358_01510 [Candidatus Limimorpha sp.]